MNTCGSPNKLFSSCPNKHFLSTLREPGTEQETTATRSELCIKCHGLVTHTNKCIIMLLSNLELILLLGVKQTPIPVLFTVPPLSSWLFKRSPQPGKVFSLTSKCTLANNPFLKYAQIPIVHHSPLSHHSPNTNLSMMSEGDEQQPEAWSAPAEQSG